MNILVLSPYPQALFDTLGASGDKTISTSGPVDLAYCHANGVDWIVSYGYRRMLRGKLVTEYDRRAVNLHISYLPWNRGADPAFWSWFDHTPHGVTVHFIDEGMDTGDIVDQELVSFSGSETLASSYRTLRQRVEGMFSRLWPPLRTGEIAGTKQRGLGSFHRSTDKKHLFEQLSEGWETPVREVAWLGRESQMRGSACQRLPCL